jgi:iron-sulfur cluster repair protein YtfE (RIC family)
MKTVAPFAVSRFSAQIPSVDLYGPVHKGLRHALSTLLVRMGQASFAEAGPVVALLEDLGAVLALAVRHVEHEEEHIHPALEARSPGASASLAYEHDEHDRDVAELRALAAALRGAPPAARPAFGRTLYLAYSQFVSDTLAHMTEEERVIMPLLESLYSTEELQAIHERIVTNIRPGEMLSFLKIMLPAVSREERAAMLAGPKASMPDEAFEAILATARPTLSADDWEDLTARLAAA